MHWFSLNCNTVAGKLHDLVPQFIQQRFCCCLHIAAQAEGDSAGIKLGDILESREIFFLHRDTQTDADHVQGALCSNFLQDEPLFFRVAPIQCAVLNGCRQYTVGAVGQGYNFRGRGGCGLLGKGSSGGAQRQQTAQGDDNRFLH